MSVFMLDIYQRIDAVDGETIGRTGRILPFAPWSGLRLYGLMVPLVDEGEMLHNVGYDQATGRFVAALAEDDAHRSGATLRQARELYAAGWEWGVPKPPIGLRPTSPVGLAY